MAQCRPPWDLRSLRPRLSLPKRRKGSVVGAQSFSGNSNKWTMDPGPVLRGAGQAERGADGFSVSEQNRSAIFAGRFAVSLVTTVSLATEISCRGLHLLVTAAIYISQESAGVPCFEHSPTGRKMGAFDQDHTRTDRGD